MQGSLAWSIFSARVSGSVSNLLFYDLDNLLVENSTMIDKDPTWCKKGRDGDHLMVMFQCDMCYFVNIQRRLPRVSDKQDKLLLLTLQ